MLPATRLLQSNAPLKALLTAEDIRLLIGHGSYDGWAIGAAQKNSNQDRFLSGLAIDDYHIDDFKSLLSVGDEAMGVSSKRCIREMA